MFFEEESPIIISAVLPLIDFNINQKFCPKTGFVKITHLQFVYFFKNSISISAVKLLNTVKNFLRRLFQGNLKISCLHQRKNFYSFI